MTADADLLGPEEVGALREAVADAVLATPTGLARALDDDPLAYLRLLAATSVACDETGRLLRGAVDGARSAGHSWDAIGHLLGVSRQAAQQRFGAAAQVAAAAVQSTPARRVLRPLNAFDEMAALEVAGRHGWRSVACGALHHVVEASPWQWEHRRVLALGRRRHQLEEQGWQLVGTMWFPWAYYTRRLDALAVPE